MFMYYVFTTEMGIARLWLLVACILWVMCWSEQRANGQQGMCICSECGTCDLLKDNPTYPQSIEGDHNGSSRFLLKYGN